MPAVKGKRAPPQLEIIQCYTGKVIRCDKLLNRKRFAERLGISLQRFRYWQNHGHIPAPDVYLGGKAPRWADVTVEAYLSTQVPA